MSTSEQRKSAEAVVAAFNKMDIDTIMSYRSPDCLRYYLPITMGYEPQANDSYERSLRNLTGVFKDYSLTIEDIVEDRDARSLCLWLTARANTAAGLYENDYVWLWYFDESGTKILRSKEFSDSIRNREFWPQLSAAMRSRREEQEGTEQDEGEVKVQA